MCMYVEANFHAPECSKENLLLVKMKEKNLLKIQPLPKVLRVQAIRSKQLRNKT